MNGHPNRYGTALPGLRHINIERHQTAPTIFYFFYFFLFVLFLVLDP
jgi:hypothetical protein